MRRVFLLILMAFLPMVASAYTAKIDGIYYNFLGNEAIVTYLYNSPSNYQAYTGAVVIPSSVTYNDNIYSVTSIGNSAFSWCEDLTAIIIPNTVTSIRDDAFKQCSSLTSFNIPNSVTSIGMRAFYVCSALTSVNIPNNLKSIADSAFAGCSSLTSITISNSVTTIGENAFNECNALEKVIVSDITAWCGISFNGYESNPLSKAHHLFCNETTEITELVIPNTIISIGNYAFRNCTGLTSVTIPNGVKIIGDFAFDGCSGLTSISIPNSVTRIGNAALWGCTGLTSIPIPNSVTYIGYKAFENCTSLNSITIPESVTTIGEYAFRNCYALKKVVVPNIAAWCGISFDNYTANPLAIACHLFSDETTEINDLVIPNGVSIKNFVFSGCRGLTSITIPESVTSIGKESFTNCTNLRDFYCQAENVPQIFNNSFKNITLASVTLHVPKISIDLYKSASIWSSFGTIVSLEDGFDEEQRLLIARYIGLLITAKKELAAVQGGGYIDLIQNVCQLSSPYTEPSEGSLLAVLDGDINTFWHSNWKSGIVGGGIHYLQTDLINQENERIYATFTRRPTPNDHVTNMSVLGTNDPNAKKTGCEELLTFSCPYTNYTETIISPTFDTKGYRYLRFYANTTTTNRGFWHISEFQLIYDVPSSDVLVNFMDGEDEKLQAIINKQANLKSYQIGEVEYNALKEVYDAFMAKLSDIIDGIETLPEDSTFSPISLSRYNLSGHRISSPQRGLNIIRYSDGTTKKELMK